MTYNQQQANITLFLLIALMSISFLFGASSWPTPQPTRFIKTTDPSVVWLAIGHVETFTEGGAAGCLITSGSNAQFGVAESADEIRMLMKAVRVWPSAPASFVQVKNYAGVLNVRTSAVLSVSSRIPTSSDGFNTEIRLASGSIVWVTEMMGIVVERVEAATSAAPPDNM